LFGRYATQLDLLLQHGA